MGNKLTQTRYGTMLYPECDTVIGKSLELYGEWYQSEMDCMKPYLPKGGVCIDIGANIGCHTLFFAQMIGKDGMVFAFEPQRILFQILCANTALNGWRNIYTFPCAVGRERGTIHLPHIDYDLPGNFGMLSACSQGMPVDLISLDQFTFPRIDLIKVDVEGMEPEVLLGAKKTIETHHPVLYLEYHPEKHSCDLMEILCSLGYEAKMHMALGYSSRNFKQESHNIHGNFQERNLLCIATSPHFSHSLGKSAQSVASSLSFPGLSLSF